MEAEEQGEPAAAEEVETAHTFPARVRGGKEEPCASGAALGFPAPATQEDRAQAGREPTGPQSRHRPRSPRLRDRQVLSALARVRPLDRVPSP